MYLPLAFTKDINPVNAYASISFEIEPTEELANVFYSNGFWQIECILKEFVSNNGNKKDNF